MSGSTIKKPPRMTPMYRLRWMLWPIPWAIPAAFWCASPAPSLSFGSWWRPPTTTSARLWPSKWWMWSLPRVTQCKFPFSPIFKGGHTIMSILVSGGAGYIGSHTCVELIQAGHDIVVVDNFVNSCPEAIHRVEQITGTIIPFVEADLCDAAAVEQIFNQYPDIDS